VLDPQTEVTDPKTDVSDLGYGGIRMTLTPGFCWSWSFPQAVSRRLSGDDTRALVNWRHDSQRRTSLETDAWTEALLGKVRVRLGAKRACRRTPPRARWEREREREREFYLQLHCRLEMGKNRHLLGSVLFGFYDFHGSVRVLVLLGNVTFIWIIIYKLTINVFLKLQDCWV